MLGGEEYFETSPSAIRDIGKYLIAQGLEKKTLYDFGSSRWNFMYALLKICPKLETVGIENDGLKIACAKFENLFHIHRYRISFLKTDFFAADISKADIIFIYVPRVLLPELEKKLQKELKKGAIVITYRISFSHWKPKVILETDIIDRASRNSIFIYEMAPR